MIIDYTYPISVIEINIKTLYSKRVFIAPVPGLEPGTRGLTLHFSNQLSYTGKKYLFKAIKLYKQYNI